VKPKQDTSELACWNYSKKCHIVKGYTKPKVDLQNMRTIVAKHIFLEASL